MGGLSKPFILEGSSPLLPPRRREMLAAMKDRLGRPLQDLRISLTDRCNFRCRYCMPVEVFGPGYQFLPKDEILTFDEILRVTEAALALGVQKVRLTGGEPLLRRDAAVLVGMLRGLDPDLDIAMTSNGMLLRRFAADLKEAGLSRVTVSLDAIDPGVFAKMNGVGAKVEKVLDGVQAATDHGLPVKVNSVIQRGVNEQQIVPLLQWAAKEKVIIRFIEYMDVGETNRWKTGEVVTTSALLKMVRDAGYQLQAMEEAYRGETARRWRYQSLHDGKEGAWHEMGVISSVSQPFCRDCSRLRISASGHAFTCLFAGEGRDLRPLLREGGSVELLAAELAGRWRGRDDRYSELRGEVVQTKAEMSYLGG